MFGIKTAAAVGIFVAGAVFGKIAVSGLKSNGAKKVYTQCTAAVLRGKDSVMKTAAAFKENCGDIYADAVDMNAQRYAAQEAARVEAARAIVDEYSGEEAADAQEEE